MTTSLPTRLSDTVGRARLRIKGDNSKRDLPYRTIKGTRTETVKERGLRTRCDGRRTIRGLGHGLGKSELCGMRTILLLSYLFRLHRKHSIPLMAMSMSLSEFYVVI